jgi:indole-3-glycerol phosphate synthase
MAALEDETATDIEAVALELGMDVLVEIHDRVELERALRAFNRRCSVSITEICEPLRQH